MQARVEPYKTFRQKESAARRMEISTEKRAKYPDRVPVVIEPYQGRDAQNRLAIGTLSQPCMLPRTSATVGELMYVLRKRLTLDPSTAIILTTNPETKRKTLPPVSCLLGQLYAEHHDVDGFLYLEYSGESAFGGDSSL